MLLIITSQDSEVPKKDALAYGVLKYVSMSGLFWAIHPCSSPPLFPYHLVYYYLLLQSVCFHPILHMNILPYIHNTLALFFCVELYQIFLEAFLCPSHDSVTCSVQIIC